MVGYVNLLISVLPVLLQVTIRTETRKDPILSKIIESLLHGCSGGSIPEILGIDTDTSSIAVGSRFHRFPNILILVPGIKNQHQF